MMHAIITTIQRPTASVRTLARRLTDGAGHLVIAGDTKGPNEFDLSDVDGFVTEQLTFLAIEDQFGSGFRLATLLPTKHYSRKNIAYLHSIRQRATCIYETDDDNAPLDQWQCRAERLPKVDLLRSSECDGLSWVNVYRHFSDQLIWPRGLPLDRIHSISQPAVESANSVWAPIQQGLANGSPDVDAIWRLVLDREFIFKDAVSAMLPPGQWCPFNTQSTWWWPVVYPLLYIPSYCSFRMCDIWKSFIAQRCLWELGTGVVFHAPEVWQDRNVHNLMRDFDDEVPGYQQNHRIAEILESLSLETGVEHVVANLKTCYAALIDAGIFPAKEMELVDAWIEGLDMAKS